MKRFLIQLGKAWSVIQRDGLVRGMKRIQAARQAIGRPISTGDILFISGGVGDSARYRTIHVAEELRLKGFATATTVQDHRDLFKTAEQFQVFIFHRTLVTEQLAKFIARLKELKKTIIFETDDLVYDPAFLVHMDYWQQMNALERKLYEHGVGGEVLADPSVETATTTTNFLADKLREKGKQVFVVPNKLSEQDVEWAKKAGEQKRNDESVIRVGYLSGTPSHNKDFATLTEALLKLFATYPSMRLVLTGPLDTESELNQYNGRIERVPFVAREKLFDNIASLDINLAPLEIGNPFCEAKSELKFFEAGIVKVPTVAAATGTFREAIMDGVDGYVAATSVEWEEKIGNLIKDKALRDNMGEKAYHTALDRYTTRNAKNEAYYNYLRSRIQA